MSSGQGKEEPTGDSPTEGFFAEFVNELVNSPVNIFLTLAILWLLYKIIQGRRESNDAAVINVEPPMPKMKKRDMTLEELRKYDGTYGEGRVLLALNGKIIDVTKGKRLYGPDGTYSALAGRDATRALGMFQIDLVKDEYDDLSDLDTQQMESVREWEAQLTDKYDVVGRLLKPGEDPTSYSDDEEETEEKKG